MKSYIKPEAKVYKVRIESLLCGSGIETEDGQLGCGFAPKRDFSLCDEENGDGHTGRGDFWED